MFEKMLTCSDCKTQIHHVIIKQTKIYFPNIKSCVSTQIFKASVIHRQYIPKCNKTRCTMKHV